MDEANYRERQEEWHTQNDDEREYYDIDYGRVIHSAAFRRLQGKTQILNLGESDFYRNRLTHSLEVSQIAEGITLRLRNTSCAEIKEYLPENNLIAAIGAIHDLGHPPFGHGGEIALNYCMKDAGGFEGNGQTLRILTKFEHFSENHGANLSRRTLLGCLKYPISFNEAKKDTPRLVEENAPYFLIDRKACKPPKCYLDTEQDVVDWLLDPLCEEDKKRFQKKEDGKSIYQSLDCSIMNLADDISYGVHDLEDAIALKLVTKEKFQSFLLKDSCAESKNFFDTLETRYPKEKKHFENFINGLFNEKRKRHIGRLVHYFITGCEVKKDENFKEPLLKYQAKMKTEREKFLEKLKEFVRKEVIFSPNVQQLEFKGQRMVIEVFNILLSDPVKFIPKSDQQDLTDAKGEIKVSKCKQKRIVCDYIAGMTDSYLLKTYERLCSPGMGSIFERL